MDEWHLIQEAQAGSHEAFAHLVAQHDAFLKRLVAQYVSPAEVADAAQEIWLAVYRKLWQLEDARSFRPWLKQVVFYQCINLRKVRQRRRQGEAYLSSEAWLRITECVADDDARVEDLLERSETRRLVGRLLGELPAGYGQFLRLRYLKHLAYKEIATLTELPESTVKWRIHEAKRLLRLQLMTLAKEGRGFAWRS